MNTFLLIDITLIGKDCPIPPLANDSRPSWVFPLYDEKSYKVTPLLIALQDAIASESISHLMQIWNSPRPQLHASIIHSDFSLAQLGIHLQQFTYIVTNGGKMFTFRFADCAVLSCLPDLLTSEQWQAMTKPVARWAIHGRDGKLRDLPLTDSAVEASEIPLVIEEEQYNSLKDALFPDRLIYQLRRIRPAQMEHHDQNELYVLVMEAYSMWRDSGQTDQLLLMDFLLGAIDTEGRILRMIGMNQILATSSVEAIRMQLKNAISRNSFAA